MKTSVTTLFAATAIASVCMASAAFAGEAPAPALDGLLDAIKPIAMNALAIFGGSSVLSALLPQGERGTWWGFARKVIDAAAWNWGNATNEPKV
jgi:hypothetical protein